MENEDAYYTQIQHSITPGIDVHTFYNASKKNLDPVVSMPVNCNTVNGNGKAIFKTNCRFAKFVMQIQDY